MFEVRGDDGLLDTEREQLWQMVHSENEDVICSLNELVVKCQSVSRVLWDWVQTETAELFDWAD